MYVRIKYKCNKETKKKWSGVPLIKVAEADKAKKKKKKKKAKNSKR